ncbi:MAG: hypothetical protein HY748_15355 [Elusimicrobia bacterium]|nr:hypothetical protein [Elusimicrobiota bacterium]
MSRTRVKAPEKPGLGVRLNIPYLQGTYLALNAIPDAYFLGDGPSCVFAKAEQVHGRHDLFSNLLSCGCDHRVQYTGVNVFTIAGNFEAGIMAAMKRIASWPGCGVFFMGSMPMCSIAGTDYERLLREALGSKAKPSFLLPRRSAVYGDWLDGYAAMLSTMAAGMDLSGAQPRAGEVALVGYFMDRNEGDHHGNVVELERMLRALGLGSASIWLSGRPYESLREARHAEAVISLPHGREAGKVLARRLGVKLVEAELPFGLEASKRFIVRLGKELGRERAARDFIEGEAEVAASQLERFAPAAFGGRKFTFCGDPHHACGFVEQVEGFGGRVASMLLIGGEHHATEAQRGALLSHPMTVFEPMTAEVEAGWGRDEGIDLVVSNTLALKYTLGERGAWLELGFPSAYTHFLKDEPFLGPRGAVRFLARAANELARGLYMGKPSEGAP